MYYQENPAYFQVSRIWKSNHQYKTNTRMSSASWLQREGCYTSLVGAETVMEWKYIKMTFILLLLKSILNLI